MRNAAVIGYGNIGKFVLDALVEAGDFNISGVVRRNPDGICSELKDFCVTDDIKKLKNVDVAIICSPSRLVPEKAKSILSAGINTVDSYDIHSNIWEVKTGLNETARTNGAVSVISAGWDPGSDSVMRCLFEAMLPKGLSYTNFGPGMSMGHTVAVKALTGVKNALSMTIPKGTGLHMRMVYVELDDGVSFGEIEQQIKNDPYFVHDETHIRQVDDVTALMDMGHGVSLERKGVSGKTHNQLLKYEMKINNPALTAQIMVSAARASFKCQPGCYTLIEIPPIYFLDDSAENIIRRLV